MVTTLLLFVLAADASQPERVVSGVPIDRLTYVEQKLAEANQRRTTGIILSIAGGVGVAAGVTTVLVGAGQASRGDISNSETVAAVIMGVGAGVSALGLLSAGIGTVFWVSGGRDVTHYERKKDDLVLSLAPMPGGVALAGYW